MEEVVGQLVTRGLLKPMTLKALWLICSNAFDRLSNVSQQANTHMSGAMQDILNCLSCFMQCLIFAVT